MDNEGITLTGIDELLESLNRITSDSPGMKKHLQAEVRKIISSARKNVIKDASGVLENDPRNAYKAVRSSVYKRILGGQVNILRTYKRGTPTSYQPHRKLDDNPHQRGGNRRKVSLRTLQVNSYEGIDRGFILRFVNAGTKKRITRYGNRESITARHWFGRSSAFQLQQAADEVVELIEKVIQQEFQLM